MTENTPTNNPNILHNLNFMKTPRGLVFGIRAIALGLHQAQKDGGDRASKRCIAYQDEITSTFRELGFETLVETDPEADVDYATGKTDPPRGHAIGFIAIPNEPTVIAFDASIEQSHSSVPQEIVRIFASNKPERSQQIYDISQQLRQLFGGTWDPTTIELGLEINQDLRLNH